MLKVAIICKTLLKGGAEKQALLLAKSLPGRNIDVCLINLNINKTDSENLRFIIDNSIEYYPQSGKLFEKLRRVRKILQKENVTYIVSYLTLANFLGGINKILNKKIKIIGGIRNEKLPFYKFLLEKIIHNYVNDATVFNNYSGKEKFVERGFNPDKISVIQNAIEFDLPEPSSGKDNDREIRIITIGRFVKQKDYATALHSFKLLADKVRSRNFKYLIVGYGPLENEIRTLAEELKIDDKIEILINPPDIPKILTESDIFLSTSLFEGVSNSIMEAMVAGLPVVATDVGDNRFLISNGFNGFLVPCKEIDSIVGKLKLLAESEDLRRKFGNNSRTILEIDFSREKLVDRYIRLFSKLNQSRNR